MKRVVSWCIDEVKDIFTLNFWIPRGDKLLWIAILFLALFSLVFIYSSTGNLAIRKNDGVLSYYFWQQILFLALGYFVIMFVQRKSCYAIIDWVPYLMVIPIILMAISGGRWLTILPGLTIQPSELVKLTTVMFMARDISYHQDASGYNFSWKRMWLPGVAIILIFANNISTAILLSVTCFIMVCVGRLPWKKILLVVTCVGALGAVTVPTLLSIPQEHVNKLSKVPILDRVPTLRARLDRYFHPIPRSEMSSAEIRDNQAMMAEITISSGGPSGRGPGNSTQGIRLPEVFSDYMFAIIVEEAGWLGMFFVMACYTAVLIAAFRIMFRCKSLFLGLMVMGMVTCLLLQALIHMLVSVGIFPVTGQTLPMLSKGGTSTIIVCLEFGIMLSVSNTIQKEEEQKLRQEEELARQQMAVQESVESNESGVSES